MFDKIGDALGGVFGGEGGLGGILGGITDLVKSVTDSPLGGLLSMVFPGAGALMQGADLFSGLLGELSNSVGGEENY